VGYYVRAQRLLGVRFGGPPPEAASPDPEETPATDPDETSATDSEETPATDPDETSTAADDQFSFEQASPGEHPAAPWQTVSDPTAETFDAIEVRQAHATHGTRTLHLTGNGELDRVLVGFDADLTDVSTVRCDVFIERANVSWGEIWFGRWLDGESDRRIWFLGQTGSGDDRFDRTGEFTDLEGDLSELSGTHELVFNIRGDNEAFVDNQRFYDADGTRLPVDRVIASA